MAQAVEITTSNHLSGIHVKAHSGEAVNEMVNTLAGDAMRHGWQMQDPPLDLRQAACGKRSAMEWWSLILQTQKHDPTLPAFTGSALRWIQSSQEPRIEKSWLQAAHSKKRSLVGKMKLLQYNVLSIADNAWPYGRDDGLSHFAAITRAQLSQQCIHAAGFQETRAKSSGLVQSATWLRYVSQATRSGHGGCELWLNRDLPIDEEGTLTFQAANTIVIHSTPTQLVVKTRLGQLDYVFIVAQGPHSGRSDDLVSWWKQLREVIERQGAGAIYVGLFDANAHFDRDELPHVGPHQLEARTNIAAEQMTHLLKRTGTCALNTFDSHEGTGHTWTHWKGSLHRNDYIVVPVEWNAPGSVSTWTERCLDTGNNALDHTPLLAALHFAIRAGGGKSLNVAKLAKQSQEQLGDFFGRLEIPAWDTNVHEQGARMVSTLQNELRRQFGQTRRPPRKTYISDESWALRMTRIDIKRSIDKEEAELRLLKMRTAFYAWRQSEVDFWQRATWRSERHRYCKSLSQKWQSLKREAETPHISA